MNDDYLVAKAIILKSLKSGKLLTEFKAWDNLDFNAKRKALLDSTCPVCGKIKELTGTWGHYYGTESACKDCCDEINYSLLFNENGERKSFWEVA